MKLKANGESAMAQPSIASDIPVRLDRLPWSRWHWLVLFGLGSVWILDGLEVTLTGSIATSVSESGSGLDITTAEVTGTAAALYVSGACAGAILFGQLAEKLGRKRLFTTTLVIYLAASFATALSHQSWWFFLFRFITGLAVGGEYVAVGCCIDELMPSAHRGRIGLAVNSTFWVGAMGGALVTSVLLDPSLFSPYTGWRLAFALGSLLGLAVLFIRRHVPESPRWLLAHGREEEAEAIVRDIEQRVSSPRRKAGPTAGAAVGLPFYGASRNLLWTACTGGVLLVLWALASGRFIASLAGLGIAGGALGAASVALRMRRRAALAPPTPPTGKASETEERTEWPPCRSEGRTRELPPVKDVVTVQRSNGLGLLSTTRILIRSYPRRVVLCLALFAGQAFLYNSITFGFGAILSSFYGIPGRETGCFFAAICAGNFLGPILLGGLFDSIGRRIMISSTYIFSGITLLITAALFAHGSLTALTLTACWCIVLFFASAGASSAYLTASEIFPAWARSTAISFFYAVGTLVGGVSGPLIFSRLTQSAIVSDTVIAFSTGASLMIGAGIVAAFFAVKAERRGLEDVAP